MPLTDDHRKFLERFVIQRAGMARIREDAANTSEVGKVADGLADTLEAKLARVGRVRDKTADAGDQVRIQQERREEHLRDILLRDEDGLNANQIVLELAPVSKEEFELARKPIPKSTVDPDYARIKEAHEKVDKQRAMQMYVGDELLARRAALMPASDRRAATNKAIADLAGLHNANSLSHHASRHGPQTTIEQHVIRVATGFAPDDPLPGGLTATAVNTRAGGPISGGAASQSMAVDIPDVVGVGPHYASGASRSASGETALYMLEDALAKVHESQSYGQTTPGQTYAVRTLKREGDVVVGESAELEAQKHPSTGQVLGYRDSTGASNLPGKNPTSGAVGAAFQAIAKRRAEAVLVDREVKSTRVAVEAMPDGSFRTITAFPDSGVTADSYGLSTGSSEADVTAKPLAAERAAAQQAAIDQAKQYENRAKAEAADDRAAKDAAKATKEAEYRDALTKMVSIFTTHEHGKLLQDAGIAARNLDKARSELAAIEEAIEKTTETRDKTVATIEEQIHRLPGLRTTLDAERKAYEAAATDSDKRARAEAYQKATDQLHEAEAILNAMRQARKECDTFHLDLAKDQAEAAAELAVRQKAADTARTAAVEAAGETDTRAAIDAQKACDAASAAFDKIRKELRILDDKAALATALVEELEAQRELGAQPTDDEVQKERDDRKAALVLALAKSSEALAKAKAEWSSEIDAVQAMFDEDNVIRENSLKGLIERREKAHAALMSKIEDVEQAEALLAGMKESDDPQSYKLTQEKLAALKEEMEDKRARNRALKSRVKSDRQVVARQKESDAANLAMARAALETLAAEAEAEQAERDDAPDKVAKLKAAAVRKAEEKLKTLQRDHLAAKTDVQDARNAERLANFVLARTEANLAGLKDQLAKDIKGLDPDPETWRATHPAAYQLMKVTVPAIEAKKANEADNLKTAADRLTAAIKVRDDLLQEVRTATTELKAAKTA